jgi:outer membrane protein OmpA-like peptidoglycan-associated protein
MRSRRLALCTTFGVVLAASTLNAQTAATRTLTIPLPPAAGFTMVQALTTPTADRESVHSVNEVSAGSLHWVWRLVEVHSAGDTLRGVVRYAERLADISDAYRLLAYQDIQAPENHPGYTMHAISRALYRQLLAQGSDSMQVMTAEFTDGAEAFAALGLGANGRAPVRWRGTVSLVTPTPEPFPLLVNGERVEVPALHLRGRFSARQKQWEPQFWVLADSAYPLLLKWIGAYQETGNVLQTVRVDLKNSAAADLAMLEKALASTCRAELPGIYFAFNSAVLDSASDRAIASVARLLDGHPDWRITLEGHTDSIGSRTANQALSERRVEAVRARLVAAHGVEGARVRTAGLGSTVPRESNKTIEGRARNRRVEMVRECARP